MESPSASSSSRVCKARNYRLLFGMNKYFVKTGIQSQYAQAQLKWFIITCILCIRLDLPDDKWASMQKRPFFICCKHIIYTCTRRTRNTYLKCNMQCLNCSNITKQDTEKCALSKLKNYNFHSENWLREISLFGSSNDHVICAHFSLAFAIWTITATINSLSLSHSCVCVWVILLIQVITCILLYHCYFVWKMFV